MVIRTEWAASFEGPLFVNQISATFFGRETAPPSACVPDSAIHRL